MSTEQITLKSCLDSLYDTFDAGFLSTDPLEFVHRYDHDADREIVGLVASSLAYGRVEGIRRSLEKVFGVMGRDPYGFTMRFDPARDRRLFSGFKHRFNDGNDIACLIYFARQMIEECGSIGGFFMKGYSLETKSIKDALTAFTRNVLALDSGAVYGPRKSPAEATVRFFFPSPAQKSACKRLNLYLRWMVRRRDGLDFGIWDGVDPASLIIPLDTHIARISRNIGLTTRASADWKMAEEITARLRELDPADPLKYDFSLCRLGILDRCPRRLDTSKCESCLIKNICVL